jgi:hypothetical protein
LSGIAIPSVHKDHRTLGDRSPSYDTASITANTAPLST